MSKLDEKKEFITSLRVYLGFILAIILSIGAGLSKLYISNNINILFWIGIILVILCIVLFIKLSQKMHKEIKSLRKL